jgi:O-acetyl-ADP-ribose deacetylase (regulator of RNase III)
MQRLEVLRGDITRLAVDAIVNAANERMVGGGGVDGAIHRAAGPELVAACRGVPEVRPGVRCPTGEARITPGFRLPARYVIHTVGPVWKGGAHREPELLASCYRASLALASERKLTSVAFPAISCGVYGYPLDAAATIAVREVTRALDASPGLERVVLCAFDEEMAAILERSASRSPHFPGVVVTMGQTSADGTTLKPAGTSHEKS